MSENLFAKNIAILRKKKGLRIVDLAEMSPKGKSMIGDYENGKSEPNIEMLIWYSDFFGIEIDKLLRTDLTHDNDVNEKAIVYKVSVPTSKNENQDELNSLQKEVIELYRENKKISQLNSTLMIKVTEAESKIKLLELELERQNKSHSYSKISPNQR